MWEIIFMVLVLKIPLIYVCWVVWWAIRAEPVIGSEGDQSQQINWTPWRRPGGSRPRRGGPHGTRDGARVARRGKRTPV
jgi:hypothetical protein